MTVEKAIEYCLRQMKKDLEKTTQHKLAAKLSMPQPVLNHLIHGKRFMGVSIQARVFKYYGLDVVRRPRK